MGIKVGFVSLGCPKNLINTEKMLALLAQDGFEIVADPVDAEVVVINTCAFIETAKSEAIDNILDIGWLKENNGLKGIVVTGCLPQRYKDEFFKELPEVDCILGTGSYDDICEAVKKAYKGEKFSCFDDIDCQKLGGERIVTTPEGFAYIQIAEGCDNRCAYCVIPDIRGKFRSRPITEIIEEATELASLGVKELCVIAQDTTRYGIDLFGTYALDSLITALSEIEGIEAIRLLYCYPDKVTDELIDVIANNDKVVKYIDLPIQHINDDVLKAMNRHGGSECIKGVIKKLRERVPGIVIRTTLIVGFPGETKEQFNELLEFVKEARFERLGVFPYSREEGTPAYDMPSQVSESTKQRRCTAIMSVQHRIHNEFNQTFVGKTIRVMCEDYDSAAECWFGRSYADAPDIDGKVFFTSPRRINPGESVEVEITKLLDYDLYGKVL